MELTLTIFVFAFNYGIQISQYISSYFRTEPFHVAECNIHQFNLMLNLYPYFNIIFREKTLVVWNIYA